jgi:hypothetical protein
MQPFGRQWAGAPVRQVDVHQRSVEGQRVITRAQGLETVEGTDEHVTEILDHLLHMKNDQRIVLDVEDAKRCRGYGVRPSTSTSAPFRTTQTDSGQRSTASPSKVPRTDQAGYRKGLLPWADVDTASPSKVPRTDQAGYRKGLLPWADVDKACWWRGRRAQDNVRAGATPDLLRPRANECLHHMAGKRTPR